MCESEREIHIPNNLTDMETRERIQRDTRGQFLYGYIHQLTRIAPSGENLENPRHQLAKFHKLNVPSVDHNIFSVDKLKNHLLLQVFSKLPSTKRWRTAKQKRQSKRNTRRLVMSESPLPPHVKLYRILASNRKNREDGTRPLFCWYLQVPTFQSGCTKSRNQNILGVN